MLPPIPKITGRIVVHVPKDNPIADFCTDPEAIILFIKNDSKIHPNISTKQTVIW